MASQDNTQHPVAERLEEPSSTRPKRIAHRRAYFMAIQKASGRRTNANSQRRAECLRKARMPTRSIHNVAARDNLRVEVEQGTRRVSSIRSSTHHPSKISLRNDRDERRELLEGFFGESFSKIEDLIYCVHCKEQKSSSHVRQHTSEHRFQNEEEGDGDIDLVIESPIPPEIRAEEYELQQMRERLIFVSMADRLREIFIRESEGEEEVIKAWVEHAVLKKQETVFHFKAEQASKVEEFVNRVRTLAVKQEEERSATRRAAQQA